MLECIVPFTNARMYCSHSVLRLVFIVRVTPVLVWPHCNFSQNLCDLPWQSRENLEMFSVGVFKVNNNVRFVQMSRLMHNARNSTGVMLLSFVLQELKKQVETAIEREKKLKSELKKKEKDLKTELDKNKVCSAPKLSISLIFI